MRGKTVLVAIGFSLFMIALGASIAYAVDLGQVGPVDIKTVGQILLTVGVVGCVGASVVHATGTRTTLAPKPRAVW